MGDSGAPRPGPSQPQQPTVSNNNGGTNNHAPLSNNALSVSDQMWYFKIKQELKIWIRIFFLKEGSATVIIIIIFFWGGGGYNLRTKKIYVLTH